MQTLTTDRPLFLRWPVWLVGFRPFFLAAFGAGALFPLLWGLSYRGLVLFPTSRLTAYQWHAHEMLFGFGWAVLGGFLLTASKNWVKVRGHHGGRLALLVGLWLLERVAVALSGRLPEPLFLAGVNLFLPAIVALVLWTLLRHRKSDFYPDNFYFVAALPLFLVAKNLLLSPSHYHHGWSMAVGLFRVAMVVMLERTLVQFMKAHFQVELPPRRLLDGAIKGLAAAAVFESFLPAWLFAGVGGLLGALLFVRFFLWRPLVSLRRLDVAIMFGGYLCLVAHLGFAALRAAGLVGSGVGNVGVHVFTVGTMGWIIPAMLARIAMGHTGRKIAFGPTDKAAVWLVVAGAGVRLVLTQLLREQYALWILLSALTWSAAFALLAARLAPFLLRPRVDGKEH